ncbi:MAG: 50S ribosomal protein L18 [Alphaproteobacteria bacterium]|jgi:large subunit ribosomal protein L18|nr:50S ribosomal protein L18 [Alphaproteobacteria bacterium]
MLKRNDIIERRQKRNRARLKKNAVGGALRLSVFRSNKNIFAQVIDDRKGHTLVAASSLMKDFDKKLKGHDKAGAEAVGKILAERAKKAGVTRVIFDRGAYLYHGRVKALADGARSGGLEF